MKSKDVVCVAIEGLRASALGAYGNALYCTAEIDRFASEARICEWMHVLRPAARQHAWLEPPGASGHGSLLGLAAEQGVQTFVVADDRAWAEQAAHWNLADLRVAPWETPQQPADDVADTQLARLFATAMEILPAWENAEPTRDGPGRLLWVDCRSLLEVWDAPLAMRDAFREEDDPPSLELVQPPVAQRTDDPEWLFSLRAAYAAQCQVLDQCVGALLQLLAEASRNAAPLLAIVGTAGFPLGEHGWGGAGCFPLFSESIHVPCLLRDPRLTPDRYAGLVCLEDLAATLAERLALPWQAPEAVTLLGDADLCTSPGRDHLLAEGLDGSWALRTHEWMLVSSPPRDEAPDNGLLDEAPDNGLPDNDLLDDGPHDGAADGADDQTGPADRARPTGPEDELQLFVKPDDRWEFNEVAALRPEETAELAAIARQARTLR